MFYCSLEPLMMYTDLRTPVCQVLHYVFDHVVILMFFCNKLYLIGGFINAKQRQIWGA